MLAVTIVTTVPVESTGARNLRQDTTTDDYTAYRKRADKRHRQRKLTKKQKHMLTGKDYPHLCSTCRNAIDDAVSLYDVDVMKTSTKTMKKRPSCSSTTTVGTVGHEYQ